MNNVMGQNKVEESVKEEIAYMFKDEEVGFDMFVLMKTAEDSLKRFVFYEGKQGEQGGFKRRIEKRITETILSTFLEEDVEYITADRIADNQGKFYIIEQNDAYKPFGYLERVEENIASFSVNDYDDAKALIFRFRRDNKVLWAYQTIQPILIPNKKKENFLAKIVSTEENDKFVEMKDSIFTITPKINLIVIGENVVTKDIGLMQRCFGFEQYIRMRATGIVSDITRIGMVKNVDKLMGYVERNKKTYAKRILRIKEFNVINRSKEDLMNSIMTVPRWKGVFDIKDGEINLRNYKDVENLIDFFEERYTVSQVTNDEFDTDVKKLMRKGN